MANIRALEKDSITPSNTLLFTNLHHTAFESRGAELRHIVEQYALTVRFIPITSFFRFLVVFESIEDAARVKEALHNVTFMGNKTLKVYYGEHTDNNHLMNPDAGQNLLRVPPLEKNFLLSPPGSPPVGWIQPAESGPAAGGHHQAMLDALSKLTDEDFSLDGGDSGSMDHDHSDDDNRMDSMDSIDSSQDSDESSSKRNSESYSFEGSYKSRKHVEERGYRANTKTKHVLTFGPPPREKSDYDDGGMEWEVTLPIVVVEDHDGASEEGESRDGSSSSLQRGLSAFSMSVNDGEASGSMDSFDSDHSWEEPRRTGSRTPLPRTSMPKTSMPPLGFR
ncbi:hypothetical protein BCR33DRAFT_711033 [Rhizoclosmatium globosum]|uniref:Calcipressin-domain-containing protein n=1 Tax=Rhizoclosmatium globosum TaxID=329046 RepID=A0A1Y2D3D3_9FUNG|nr:hypothetical protein BCR33DRAFT_711033 [Rhizoclosmatium globosum]|eukprot:ORY53654.1 hypothetical protein BCR33DRAFT_711033 [Rhizoclosmatium globosum]